MELPVVVVVLAAVVITGCVVVAVTTLRRRDPVPPTSEADAVDGDVAKILGSLRAMAILVDADGSALWTGRVAPTYGLVREGRLAHAGIASLVEEARQEGGVREVVLTLPRGPGAQSGQVPFEVRVAALTRGRVLVLAADRQAAQRLDDMRRDFVANVSHELKTPIGALALLAETVAAAADDPDAVRRFSHQMDREARRLALLVADIIELSRVQEPDALLDSRRVNVDEAVAEAVDRVKVEAAAREIRMVIAPESGLEVYGDHQLLVTAIRNLLDNAVRYSEPATRVTVTCTLSPDAMVEIAVIDQGVGISRVDLPRVFERFYRVDPARSRETGGTGLGLSIVKHVAADHGGEVKVWSTPGRGSTFTIRVPMAVEGTAEESVSESELDASVID